MRSPTITRSSSVTVRMLPNRKLSAFACTAPDVMSVTAMPTESARTIVRMRSEKFLNRPLSASIRSAAADVKIKEAPTGIDAARKAHGNARKGRVREGVACHRSAALKQRKIPDHRQSTAIQTVAVSALCMKS